MLIQDKYVAGTGQDGFLPRYGGLATKFTIAVYRGTVLRGISASGCTPLPRAGDLPIVVVLVGSVPCPEEVLTDVVFPLQ